MRYYVTKEGETPQVVHSLDGYDDWTVEGETETEDILDAIIELNAIRIDEVETIALEEIERAGNVEIARKSIILALWEEAQRFKLAYVVPGAIPTNKDACYMLFPGLMSISMLTEKPLLEVVASIEDRFWKRIKTLHLFHAKILLARDAVRKASTGRDKMKAAREVDWKDND